MKNPIYRCTYESDDNGTLLVSCADFPELVTFGQDIPDAWLRAASAIEEAIAARISEGREIPPSTPRSRYTGRNDFWIKLTQLTAQKVMLYNLLSSLGITRSELARRLKWHREQVDRLFRLDHASKADQLDAAFRALDHEVVVSVERRSDSTALRA
jgi:antitoxin HicB